jgi:STE24 endopeptidase
MLAILFSEVIFFILSPIINLVSRNNEFKADEVGSELVDKKALASALKKLVSENKHYPKVSKIYSLIYYTHPPIIERLKRLEK